MEELKYQESPLLLRFNAIGTNWEIETAETLSESVKRKIFERIEVFDQTYSRFRSDSLVSRIARASAGGTFLFPEDSIKLFDYYDQLYKITDGAVDPLVGRKLEVLGYDAHYTLRPIDQVANYGSRNPASQDWAVAVYREGRTMITGQPLVIDVGAAGKGYLVDIVAELLLAEGCHHFVIDAGGDIRHCGEIAVRIGMEDPHDPELVIGVATIQNGGICASAINKRTWGDGFHHVLDARTGVPVSDVVATWVIAADAMLADGLATALFFSNADQLGTCFNFSSVRLFKDRRVEPSKNFNGELFF